MPNERDQRIIFPLSPKDAKRLRALAARERRSIAAQTRIMVEAQLAALEVETAPAARVAA